MTDTPLEAAISRRLEVTRKTWHPVDDADLTPEDEQADILLWKTGLTEQKITIEVRADGCTAVFRMQATISGEFSESELAQVRARFPENWPGLAEESVPKLWIDSVTKAVRRTTEGDRALEILATEDREMVFDYVLTRIPRERVCSRFLLKKVDWLNQSLAEPAENGVGHPAARVGDPNSRERDDDQGKSFARMLEVLDSDQLKVIAIADGKASIDEKMRLICTLDSRYYAKVSPQWGVLLGVTPDAVRQTDFWKKVRKEYIAEEKQARSQSGKDGIPIAPKPPKR